MKISNIDFGDPVAENDIRNISNTTVFFRSQSWNAAKDSQTNLILGRKGAGKTALRFGLQHHLDIRNSVTVEIGFRAFSVKRLDNELAVARSDSFFDENHFYKNMWKYILVTSASHAIIHTPYIDREIKSRLVSAKTLLDSPSEFPSCINSNGDYSPFLAFISGARLVAEVMTSSTDPDYQLNYPSVGLYKKMEAELISVLNNECQVLITLDDFDEAYEKFHDVTQPMIIGLIEAIRDIRSAFRDKIVNFSIKSFIPYDAVGPEDFRHHDKTMQNTVHWNTRDLSIFIARRLHPQLRRIGGVPARSPDETNYDFVLKHVFDQLAPADDYRTLIERLAHNTLERPRDIVLALSKLQERISNADPDAEKITAKHLDNFLPSITTELAQLVIGEYIYKYPAISDTISLFRGCDAEISAAEIHGILNESAVTGSLSSSEWIDALYESGFLCRVFRKKHEGSGSYFSNAIVTSWKEDSPKHIEADKFVIHRLFWEYIGARPLGWAFRYA